MGLKEDLMRGMTLSGTVRNVVDFGAFIDIGVKQGIVDKAGAWYSYNGDRIGQGKAKVVDFLRENPQIAEEIEGRIRTELLPQNPTAEAGNEEE